MLFRQFCAASSRSRPLSSTRTSFSPSAKVTAETSGPTAGAVPKAGGVPAGGGVRLCASSFGATATPTIAADDVTKKLRRDFDMMFSKPRIVTGATREPARKLLLPLTRDRSRQVTYCLPTKCAAEVLALTRTAPQQCTLT